VNLKPQQEPRALIKKKHEEQKQKQKQKPRAKARARAKAPKLKESAKPGKD
jgi:hypothetical protein